MFSILLVGAREGRFISNAESGKALRSIWARPLWFLRGPPPQQPVFTFCNRDFSSTASKASHAVSGTVSKVLKMEDEYCVILLDVEEFPQPLKVIGQYVGQINKGQSVTARGYFHQHPSYGHQFKASMVQAIEPRSQSGVLSFLKHTAKGIGHETVQEIYNTFGDSLFDTIETAPNKLLRVKGIGPKRLQALVESVREHMETKDDLVFLQGLGLSHRQSVKVLRILGERTRVIVSKDPYILSRVIPGFGFKSADSVGHELGIAPDSPMRCRAALLHVLRMATREGHCGLPEAEAFKQVEKLNVSLQGAKAMLDTDPELRRSIVRDRIEDIPALFLKHLYFAEADIAQRMRRMRGVPVPWEGALSANLAKVIDAVPGPALSFSQRRAVETILTHHVTVMTGGPGTGKTFVVKKLVDILEPLGYKVVGCALTGKAATRLSEVTGLEAKTIHRLLEAVPDPSSKQGFKFKKDALNPLEGDLFVIDEASMADVSSLSVLLQAVPTRSALLIVGDVDQLPSVGPGDVLHAIIESKMVPVVRLTEIHRQDAHSNIASAAHRINQGQVPVPAGSVNGTSDFVFVESSGAMETRARVLDLVVDIIPRVTGLDPLRDVQVLCPMKRGHAGTMQLNEDLQRRLNPSSTRSGPGSGSDSDLVPNRRVDPDQSQEDEVEGEFGSAPVGSAGGPAGRSKFGIQAGDKVMQTVNDYTKEVYNGETGVVVRARPSEGLVVQFEDRVIRYPYAESDDVMLAYACTVHKAQGSEYPVVVVPISMEVPIMLRRNLLYTAVTRARRLVVLVGEWRALHIALSNNFAQKRYTKLREFLAKDD